MSADDVLKDAMEVAAIHTGRTEVERMREFFRDWLGDCEVELEGSGWEDVFNDIVVAAIVDTTTGMKFVKRGP